MFKIKNLYVSIDNKKILKDFNIDIKPGELHVITVSYTHLTLPTTPYV